MVYNRLVLELNDRSVALRNNYYIVGNDPFERDAFFISIDHDSIRERHAVFAVRNNKIYLMDLNSYNGTYLNGNKVKPHSVVLIVANDTLRFGEINMKVKIHSVEVNDSSGYHDSVNDDAVVELFDEISFEASQNITKNNISHITTANSLKHPIDRSCLFSSFDETTQSNNHSKSSCHQNSRYNNERFSNFIPETQYAEIGKTNCSAHQNTSNNNIMPNNSKRMSNDFVIPETQFVKRSTNMSNIIVNNNERDEDFFVPETQEVLSNISHTQLKNTNYKMSESTDQFRMNTQDFNEDFGTVDYSENLLEDIFQISAESRGATSEQNTTKKIESDEKHPNVDVEVSNILSTPNEDVTNNDSREDNCCTPDLFNMPPIGLPKVARRDDSITENNTEELLPTQLLEPVGNESVQKSPSVNNFSNLPPTQVVNFVVGTPKEIYSNANYVPNLLPTQVHNKTYVPTKEVLDIIDLLPPTQLCNSDKENATSSACQTMTLNVKNNLPIVLPNLDATQKVTKIQDIDQANIGEIVTPIKYLPERTFFCPNDNLNTAELNTKLAGASNKITSTPLVSSALIGADVGNTPNNAYRFFDAFEKSSINKEQEVLEDALELELKDMMMCTPLSIRNEFALAINHARDEKAKKNLSTVTEKDDIILELQDKPDNDLDSLFPNTALNIDKLNVSNKSIGKYCIVDKVVRDETYKSRAENEETKQNKATHSKKRQTKKKSSVKDEHEKCADTEKSSLKTKDELQQLKISDKVKKKSNSLRKNELQKLKVTFEIEKESDSATKEANELRNDDVVDNVPRKTRVENKRLAKTESGKSNAEKPGVTSKKLKRLTNLEDQKFAVVTTKQKETLKKKNECSSIQNKERKLRNRLANSDNTSSTSDKPKRLQSPPSIPQKCVTRTQSCAVTNFNISPDGKKLEKLKKKRSINESSTELETLPQKRTKNGQKLKNQNEDECELNYEMPNDKISTRQTRGQITNQRSSSTIFSESGTHLPAQRRSTRLKSKCVEDGDAMEEDNRSTPSLSEILTNENSTKNVSKIYELSSVAKALKRRKNRLNCEDVTEQSEDNKPTSSKLNNLSVSEKAVQPTTSKSAKAKRNIKAEKPTSTADEKKLLPKYDVQKCNTIRPVIKISTTMVEPDTIERLKMHSANKWILANDPNESDVLIMDKGNRTFKFLLAIAKGIPIVTSKYLEAVNKSKEPVNTTHFLLKDEAFENRHKFLLVESLQKSAKNKILTGYTFVTSSSIKPCPSEIKSIITAAGGLTYDEVLPSTFDRNQELYFVSCVEDKMYWQKYVRKYTKLHIIGTEAVMATLTRQDLRPLQEFKI